MGTRLMSLGDIFGTAGSISWWQECLRALVIFAYGLALVRVAGRRVFGFFAAWMSGGSSPY